MEGTYKYIKQVPLPGQDVPQDSILSQTLYENDQVKAILFRFAPEQELSEHTASVPAILHFLEGEARLVLGEDEKPAQPGTWVYMPAKQPHSIAAKTYLSMLLYLLES
ncbi:MAG: cupin domain-containing protein [Anaerolineales bacterium]